MEKNLRIKLAGAIGNLLEWYDFGLYGLLAPILATEFFPGHDRMASLIGVYGGFAAGFAMRPIGAIVLGHLGDRIGRRFVLALSVLLMGIATVVVGILPTYRSVGMWAPIFLVGVRLFQGFSVGGEYVDSVTYLVEMASPERRGFAGSIANLGSTAGMLLAAGVAAALTGLAGSTLVSGWVWRLPFLLGGVIATAAYLLRRHLPESEHAAVRADAKYRHEAPLRRAIREQPKIMLAALVFASGYGIVNYITMVLLPTYAHEFGHVAEHDALRINTAGQALALFVVPFSGWLSDRVWTRRGLLAAAFSVEAVLSWEAFRLVESRGVAGLWLAQLAFAFLLAIVMGTEPAFLCRQFSEEHRVSAYAVVFNIGIGIAGGTAPMAAFALIKVSSNIMAPAMYLIFASVLAVIGAIALRGNNDEGRAR